MNKLSTILFVSFFCFLFRNSSAQFDAYGDFAVSVGLGVSVTNLDVGTASSAGLLIDIDVAAFHMDVASNFASGKGEYLEFSSSETTKANKQVWYALNAGYNLSVKNWFVFTPKVGFIILRDIWEDPVAWNTYYEEHAGTKPQIGAEIKKQINQIYLKAGTSTTEIISLGVGFIF